MIDLELHLMDEGDLKKAFPQRWSDLQTLAKNYQESQRDTNVKVLNQMPKEAHKPLESWEPKLANDFIRVGCSLTRTVLTTSQASEEPSNIYVNSSARADWLCSLAVLLASQLDDAAKSQACALWIMTRLLANGVCEDPVAVANSAIEALQPLGLAEDELGGQIKTQIVIHIGRLTEKDQCSDTALQVAREWCMEILNSPGSLRNLLSRGKTPSILGVEIPAIGVEENHSDGQDDEVPLGPVPQFWQLPELLQTEELESEFHALLFGLYAVPDGTLSDRTASQIGEVDAESDIEKFGRAFNFAARDLWKSYWRQGSQDSLELSRRLTLFLYTKYSQEGNQEPLRADVLYSWMNTQLPLLIRTCPNLNDLISDADILYSTLKVKRGDFTLKQGLIQVHAGEHRRLLLAGEDADYDRIQFEELLKENVGALRKIHNDYRERLRNDASEDELEAWEYLESLDLFGAQKAPTGDAASGDLLSNPEFQRMLREGSHTGVYAFIQEHFDEVRDALIGRLNVKLSHEHVMMPEGVIYGRNVPGRREPHPLFTDARKAMDEGNFRRAINLLSSLASKIQGREAYRCRNYLAYAQAKENDTLRARDTLNDLATSEQPFPSVYWNRACCLPAEQMQERFESLREGLERAPHYQLLSGAISMALLLTPTEPSGFEDTDGYDFSEEGKDGKSEADNKRLQHWLSFLTYKQALLLFYYFSYDRLSSAEKDRLLLRLRDDEAPLPTGKNAKPQAISQFFEKMYELHQERAIEFWLKCRDVQMKDGSARELYNLWQLWSDFHARNGDGVQAAHYFERELRERLRVLGRSKFSDSELSAKSDRVKLFLREHRATSERAQQFLRECRKPELRDTGNKIYNLVVNFERQHARENQGRLIWDRKIHDIYRPEIPPELPEEGEDETGSQGGKGKLEGGRRSDPPPTIEIDRILISTGTKCQELLRDPASLFQVDKELKDLIEVLRRNRCGSSADALQALIAKWQDAEQQSDREDKKKAIQAVQMAYSHLQGRLQRDLNNDQVGLSRPLMTAFERVNSRLAKVMELVPTVLVEGLENDHVFFDPSASGTAFPLRVRNTSDSEQVRLMGLIVELGEDHTELKLRDNLDEIPVVIAAQQTAMLTVGLPENLTLQQENFIRAELIYEYERVSYRSSVFDLKLVARECPPLPDTSPYIFGRALEVSEIETHFFGREKEQRALLSAIREGQQRLHYVEGIRRTGKSSLLSSIQYQISKQSLSVVPIQPEVSSAASVNHAGTILFNIFSTAAEHPVLRTAGVQTPSESDCISNLSSAYTRFHTEIAEKLPGQWVLILLDEFQEIVETAALAEQSNPELHRTVHGLLNLIRMQAKPASRLLWIFAGQDAFRQFSKQLPSCLMWATLIPIPIDFLDEKAVEQIITVPIRDGNVQVPVETVARAHQLSGGHPEVTQRLAELMLLGAVEEKRHVITPADVDQAARDIADNTDDFAITWYPDVKLSADQRKLMSAFIKIVPVGGRIEPYKLLPGAINNEVPEVARKALDDLQSRKIISSYPDGTVGIRAYVLDRWLHQWLPREIMHNPGLGVHGNSAIFVDVANLTGGKGGVWLEDLNTSSRVSIATALDRIEEFAQQVTPAAVTVRFAINYPVRSPAVMECQAKNYNVQNIPQDLFTKGSDDVMLREKISDVEQLYPSVNHFVIVTGDKDFSLTADRLLKNGKFVHFIGREGRNEKSAFSNHYRELEKRYPEYFTACSIEELLQAE